MFCVFFNYTLINVFSANHCNLDVVGTKCRDPFKFWNLKKLNLAVIFEETKCWNERNSWNSFVKFARD